MVGVHLASRRGRHSDSYSQAPTTLTRQPPSASNTSRSQFDSASRPSIRASLRPNTIRSDSTAMSCRACTGASTALTATSSRGPSRAASSTRGAVESEHRTPAAGAPASIRRAIPTGGPTAVHLPGPKPPRVHRADDVGEQDGHLLEPLATWRLWRRYSPKTWSANSTRASRRRPLGPLVVAGLVGVTLARTLFGAGADFRFASVNGEPGVVVSLVGQVMAVIALESTRTK